MTADDLTRIETELQLQLPAHYRELMLAYPKFLIDAYYNSPDGGRASEALLFAAPQRVIDYNRNWRNDDFLLGEYDTEARPDRYLIIGTDCTRSVKRIPPNSRCFPYLTPGTVRLAGSFNPERASHG